MRKRSELLFSFLSVPVDVAALMAAFIVAYILRVKIDNKPVAHPIAGHDFVLIALIVMPFWILIFALAGLYSQRSGRGRLEELGKILVAVSGGVMFLILLDFASTRPLFPSKLVPIYTYLFGLILVILGRLALRAVQRSLFRYGIGTHQVLLVGSGELAQRIAHDMAGPTSGYRILGAIDEARGAARRLGVVPVYTTFQQFRDETNGKQLDDIIQADSALDQDQILELVNYAANHHISYRFVPNQFGLYATNSVLGTLSGIPVMEIRLTPLDGWGRIAKRVFDVLGAILATIVLLPVLLVVAIGVKLSDPAGPIVYRQRRLSRVGSEIMMFKFRSMKYELTNGRKYRGKSPDEVFELIGRPELAEEYRRHRKVKDDPRVTRFGRFIRRTSLDELPQLFNVIKGEMSMVGPRPIVPEELSFYGEHGAVFLALKPGITGLWQISGRSDLSYDQRVKLDIYYVENWSLLLDLKILVKTVFAVARSRGAY